MASVSTPPSPYRHSPEGNQSAARRCASPGTRHIDGGQVLATAVEQLCQLQTVSVLPTPLGPASRNAPSGRPDGAGRRVRSAGVYAGWQSQVLAFDGVTKPLRQVGDDRHSFCDRRLSGTPVHSAITAAIVFYRHAERPATDRYAGRPVRSKLCQPLYRGNCFSGLFRLTLPASSAGMAPVLSCSDSGGYPLRHLCPLQRPVTAGVA